MLRLKFVEGHFEARYVIAKQLVMAMEYIWCSFARYTNEYLSKDTSNTDLKLRTDAKINEINLNKTIRVRWAKLEPHWGQDKMDAISQMIFLCIVYMKYINSD